MKEDEFKEIFENMVKVLGRQKTENFLRKTNKLCVENPAKFKLRMAMAELAM